MMTQPAGDWSVFKQSWADHWDALHRAHPRDQTAYYEGLVAKMLACGTPETMGDVASRCRPCGPGTPRVALGGKSSLCVRCATVSVDHWGRQVRTMLHAGVLDRHSMLPVPAMCRVTFSRNAAGVLRALMRGGGPCLDECSSAGRGKALTGGSIGVRHPHGRPGPSPPHRHLIATSGGYDAQGERWEHGQDVPYALLRRTWQWHRWRLVRQTLTTEAINQRVEAWCTQSPNGLVTTVPKGQGPAP